MGGLPGFLLGGDDVLLLTVSSSVLSFSIFVFPPSFLEGSFVCISAVTEDDAAAAADESCTDVNSSFFGIRGSDEPPSFDPSLGWVLLVFIVRASWIFYYSFMHTSVIG